MRRTLLVLAAVVFVMVGGCAEAEEPEGPASGGSGSTLVEDDGCEGLAFLACSKAPDCRCVLATHCEDRHPGTDAQIDQCAADLRALTPSDVCLPAGTPWPLSCEVAYYR